MTVNIVCRLLLATLLLSVVSGCNKKLPIRQYKADKPVVVDARNRGKPDTNPTLPDRDPADTKSRMLTATFVNNDDIWFFKLSGDSKPISALNEAFLKFVRSVKFKGDAPEWELPSSWKKELGDENDIRFATITIGEGDEKQELTITRLDMPLGADADGVLLNNINRWRRQMQLGPIKRNRLYRPKGGKRQDGVLLTEWTGSHRIYLADLAGTFSSRPMGATPNFPPKTNPQTPPPSSEFSYTKPDSWKPGRMNSFRKLAFQLTDSQGSMTAEITVSVAGGALLPNVVRWRGQIGLGDMTQKEMETAMKTVPIGNLEGQFIALESQPKSILAVILERGGQKWFFKLTGQAAIAKAEKDRFLAFVKSFQFK